MYFQTAGTGIYGIDSGGAYTRRITFPEASNGAGILHGTWEADTTISTSDRRLKSNIMPLYQTLIKRYNEMAADEQDEVGESNSTSKSKLRVEKKATDAIGWMLRELRPVSFSFKDGSDAKSMSDQQRFGFIAQEVERVLPDLVHELGSTKHLVYQDLIAMITLAAQDHQRRIEKNHGEVSKLRGMVNNLAGALSHLSHRVARIVDQPPATVQQNTA